MHFFVCEAYFCGAIPTQNLRVSILISHTKGKDKNVSTALNEEEIEEAAPKIGLTS